MVKMWFTCVVTHEESNAKGVWVAKKEPYLVDAMTFTEAETRMVKEVYPELTNAGMASMKREPINEVLGSGESTWFKAVVEYDKLTERKYKETYLVNAFNMDKAKEKVKDFAKGALHLFTVIEIKQTKYVDVIFYDKEDKDELR